MSSKEDQMAKAKQQLEPLWPHLRYVTLGDVLSAIATSVTLLAILSVGPLGLYWVAEKIPAGQGEPSALPSWVIYAVIAAIALWGLRGKTLRIPRWNLGGWLCASLLVAAGCFIVTNCASWITISLFWATWVLIAMLDTLNDRGEVIAEAAAADAAGEMQQPN
jgi:hypothetical protein